MHCRANLGSFLQFGGRFVKGGEGKLSWSEISAVTNGKGIIFHRQLARIGAAAASDGGIWEGRSAGDVDFPSRIKEDWQ